MEIINFKEKEMIPLTDKETKPLMKRKKFVTYAKKNLLQIKMIKRHLNDTIK